MEENAEIGARLEHFGLEKYHTLAAFAAALRISPQNLNGYIRGIRRPGNKMKARLRALDADVEWIMTGRRSTEQTPPSAGDIELLTFLKEIGIDSIDKARELLSPEAMAQDIMLAIRERMVRYGRKKPKR
jgi:transcriptional regulator with XRE-family HTH domain